MATDPTDLYVFMVPSVCTIEQAGPDFTDGPSIVTFLSAAAGELDTEYIAAQ